MATKINPCIITGAVASVQSRFELARIAAVEIDESNENDVRVVANSDERATPWVRAKNAEDAIVLWNEANPA